jgi:hypothetical protein
MNNPDSADLSPSNPSVRGILDTSPLDDSGAATQARFRFQHDCTARLAFGMLAAADAAGGIVLVVCEEHEDAIVLYEHDVVELVSVRHYDDQTLSLPDLRNAVVGLFRRWQSTGRSARCRLMTNGKPVAGAKRARGLIDACHSKKPEQWVASVMEWTGSQDPDEVSGFLCGFSVDDPTGAREVIAAINIQHVVRPALAAAGFDLDPGVAYQRVVDLVGRCNRSEPMDDTAMLRYLADADRASARARAQERIGRRAIDRERLMEALLEPVFPEQHLQLSFDQVPVSEGSTLERKLKLGGFGPTTINAAQMLRANWEALETRWRVDVPGGDPVFADLRGRALTAAARAERRALADGTYGPAMHDEVEREFTVDGLERRPAFTIDDELLLGLVYELTDECRIWWSAEQPL